MFTKSCHGVGRCVKDGSCSSSSQWTVLMGYLTISTNVRRYQTHHRWFFFFQEYSALVHMHCACNTVQLLWCYRLPSSWTMSPTALSWMHWLQDLQSHTTAWVWVVSQKDWRNQEATSWILAMNWYRMSEKMWFLCFPIYQVVQNHMLFQGAQ